MNPGLAHSLGIRIIHQQGSTFASMTVEENFAAGSYPVQRGLQKIDWKALRRRTIAALEQFDVDVEPRQLVGDLRPGKRQLVAIVRALDSLPDGGSGVLILDEPTASLALAEVERLKGMLQSLVRAGHSVLYVTHRLEELPGFAARVTVLKDGLVLRSLEQNEVTHEALVAQMLEGLGTSANRGHRLVRAGSNDVRLRVTNLSGGSVEQADLVVRAGEVTGLAGLGGSGRSSLLQMIFGIQRPTTGTVELDGRPLRWRGGVPHAGIGYVPEDRLAEAVFLPLSVRENLLAPSTGRFWRHARFRRADERTFVRELTRRYSIRGVSSDSVPVKNLSGGNQQKTILARWIALEPKLLLLDEPTQGVDIRARGEVHAHVKTAAGTGVAVVVASSDATELATLCDRVVVLARGRTGRELSSDELTSETVERLVQEGQPTPEMVR